MPAAYDNADVLVLIREFRDGEVKTQFRRFDDSNWDCTATYKNGAVEIECETAVRELFNVHNEPSGTGLYSRAEFRYDNAVVMCHTCNVDQFAQKSFKEPRTLACSTAEGKVNEILELFRDRVSERVMLEVLEASAARRAQIIDALSQGQDTEFVDAVVTLIEAFSRR